jgi:hypothetical protein
MIHESEMSIKSRNANTEVVRKFIDGFNRHDGSVMALFTKDVSWQDPGGLEPEEEWERMQKGVLSSYKVFDGIRLEPSHIMAAGDWVCFEGMISGTYKGGNGLSVGKRQTCRRAISSSNNLLLGSFE